jgi:hypothetical protein
MDSAIQCIGKTLAVDLFNTPASNDYYFVLGRDHTFSLGSLKR